MTYSPESPRASQPTVLVVEDDEAGRWLLVQILEEARYAVIEARNADEALRCLADNPDIRLVVTDINMAGSMNGYEMAVQVKEERPQLAILLTSGRARPSSEVLPSGMEFLQKPWAPQQLLELLEQLQR